MRTDENNPEDWYRSGKVRLGSADRLYPLEGSSESVIELLQESAERSLSRIHDLGALIAEAQAYDERFGEFADFADELTDQFWAMHYPGGEFDEQNFDFCEVRSRLDGMLKLIAGPM
jgi:HEPN domain-containing protein